MLYHKTHIHDTACQRDPTVNQSSSQPTCSNPLFPPFPPFPPLPLTSSLYYWLRFQRVRQHAHVSFCPEREIYNSWCGRTAYLWPDDRCSVPGRTREISVDFFVKFLNCCCWSWDHLEDNCVADVSKEHSASVFRIEFSSIGNISYFRRKIRVATNLQLECLLTSVTTTACHLHTLSVVRTGLKGLYSLSWVIKPLIQWGDRTEPATHYHLVLNFEAWLLRLL